MSNKCPVCGSPFRGVSKAQAWCSPCIDAYLSHEAQQARPPEPTFAAGIRPATYDYTAHRMRAFAGGES